MSITITVPNDDHVALRAMAKALEEIAVARGAPATVYYPKNDRTDSRFNFEVSDEILRDAQLDTSALISELVKQAEVDTTSQQVESLVVPGATHIITEETKEGVPYVVDGGLSQGYIAKFEEIDNPVDSTGTPWDQRIHSASKLLNADGTWRLRRKPKDMDEAEWGEYVQNVQDELLGQKPEEDDKYSSDGLIVSVASAPRDVEPYDVPQEKFTPLTGFADEPSVTPAGDDFHVDAGMVTEQEVAAIPAPPAPPVHMTFPQVMQFLTERHGKVTSAQVDQIIADIGLNSIMDLNTQPEHTGPFIARVKALLGE